MATEVENRTFQFGAFELDRSCGELRKNGVKIQLQGQPVQILTLLLDRPGELLTRDEIRRGLWPNNTFVDFDNAISSAVWKIREALGDNSENPRFVQTIARRGYRFLVSVSVRDPVAGVKGVKREELPAGATGTAQDQTEQVDAQPFVATVNEASGPNGFQPSDTGGYRFAASERRSADSLPFTQGSPNSAEVDSDIVVGRAPELRKLETSLTKAVQGFGRMIFITGEPGIGKTALSNAFLRLVRSRYPAAKLSQGRCLEQYGAGEPYLPVLDSLSALLSGSDREFVAGVLRSYAPTWCLQFPSVFASDGARERLYRETVGATKERMLREMVDALGALASAAPLVLHFEDLHWADPSSTDLLRRLCHDVGNHRLLVTGTFRPADIERGNRAFKTFLLETQTHNQCEEMALGLLSQEALSEYLNTRFAPNQFDSDLAVLIHRKTEGQPLFATSLVQFLIERGDIARIGEYWSLTRPLSELDLEVPVNVRKMIQRKIGVLEAVDLRALEYASIQGEEFTSALLAGLLDTDDMALEERLDRLDKVHRLIQTIGEEELPDGTFHHALSIYACALSERGLPGPGEEASDSFALGDR